MTNGLFISFEGIDGAGKSTHIEQLAVVFKAAGRPVTLTREPGGTALAEKLRALVLGDAMDALTESLLVFAARRDHLQQVIEPALGKGEVVLCDRFTDATFAYQGGGRGFDFQILHQLEQWVQALPAGGLRQPDLTLWFDLPAEIAAQRLAGARVPDRFESQPVEFFRRVVQGYAAREATDPKRFARIDAAQDVPAVWNEVLRAARQEMASVTAASTSALAPWVAAQAEQLLAQRGHAWLLQGPSGLGQYDLALELARAWLCDQPSPHGACGQCGSCHAVEVHTHADLCVLMPETVQIELGWPLSEKAQQDIDDKKRKASKEIRVEAMRDAVEFAQRTSGRGRGKAVLVYPAERMNHVSANALLKTLEEPPGDVRFVLSSEAAHQLLPTIRSRCLGHTMVWPDHGQSLAWLCEQGVSAADAPVFLRAAGGRPEDALNLSRSGLDPKFWALLPKALARGDAGALADWAPANVVGALQKLCHDLLVARAGASPRFFAPEDLPPPPTLMALTAWSGELGRSAATAEHPFNAGLMLEALVSRACHALNSRH